MLGQQDSVGLVTFDTKIRNYIPPRSRVSHLRVLIDELQRGEPGGETELGDVFHDLVPEAAPARLARSSSPIASATCPRCSRRSPISATRITRSSSSRSGTATNSSFRSRAGRSSSASNAPAIKHLLDPVLLREAYLANLEKFRDELTRGCRRHKIDLVPFTTDQPYAEALAAYVAEEGAGMNERTLNANVNVNVNESRRLRRRLIWRSGCSICGADHSAGDSCRTRAGIMSAASCCVRALRRLPNHGEAQAAESRRRLHPQAEDLPEGAARDPGAGCA